MQLHEEVQHLDQVHAVDSELSGIEERFEKLCAELHERIVAADLPSLHMFPQAWQVSLVNEISAFTEFLTVIKGRKANPKIYIEREFLLSSTALNGGHHIFSDGAGQVFTVSELQPKEKLLYMLYKLRKIFELYLRQELQIPADSKVYFIRELYLYYSFLNSSIEKSQQNHDRVREMQQGVHFLSHGVPHRYLLDVLREGHLSSRKSQLPRLGRANHNTATPGGEDIENSEVCFGENSLYGNIGTIYFIFPAGFILQNQTQFYNYDGIHVFDPQYSADNQFGFEMTLSESPHFMLARNVDRLKIMDMFVEVYGTDLAERRFADIFFIDTVDINSLDEVQKNELYTNIHQECAKRLKDMHFEVGSYLVPSNNQLEAGRGRWNTPRNLYSFVD